MDGGGGLQGISHGVTGGVEAFGKVPVAVSDTAEGGGKKKRNQVQTACVPCKKAHAACSFTRPCDRCVRLNDKCEDAVQQPRQKRPQVYNKEKKIPLGEASGFVVTPVFPSEMGFSVYPQEQSNIFPQSNGSSLVPSPNALVPGSSQPRFPPPTSPAILSMQFPNSNSNSPTIPANPISSISLPSTTFPAFLSSTNNFPHHALPDTPNTRNQNSLISSSPSPTTPSINNSPTITTVNNYSPLIPITSTSVLSRNDYAITPTPTSDHNNNNNSNNKSSQVTIIPNSDVSSFITHENVQGNAIYGPNLEAVVNRLMEENKELKGVVQYLSQAIGELQEDVALVKSKAVIPQNATPRGSAGCGHAVWSLPDFRLVECNQGFLDLFGWKVVPYEPFYLHSLLKVDINKMLGHCTVLQDFLAMIMCSDGTVRQRNVTKRFKRLSGESFTCTVVLSLILERNAFVTVLYEV